MRNVLLSVFAGIAVLACGSGDIRKDSSTNANAKGNGAGGGDGTVTPGSRIVPLSYQGNDGSKTFAGLFDKQLQKTCAFEPFGSTYACVPSDVYTVNAEIFYDSHSNSNPALYLDPTCDEPNAIALPDDGSNPTVMRIAASSCVPGTQGCSYSDHRAALAVLTPLPSGKKIYAYGQGGGQCCSCAEWVPPKSTYAAYRAYAVTTNPTDSQVASANLVTGTIDYPPP